MSKLAIDFQDIAAAHERIKPAALRTPVMTSSTADAITGAKLFFKCENFQRVGAFKFRGAYNALAQFNEAQRAKGVVAFSAGNHAQGIALAAQILKMRAVIVMPADAPQVKIEATRGYGAEIVLYDRKTENREAISKKLAEDQELTLIPSYDHPHIMAGQGTLAKELIEETGPLDMLIAPVGGGGLLSGCAVAVKAMSPACAVIGVEPEAGNDAQQSLCAGKIIHIDVPQTIADGAQTQHLGNYTFPVLQEYVAGILTVSDRQLVDAMAFTAERMKIMAEPTGCLAVAAALSGVADVRGKKVGIVISGGNIDLKFFASLIQEGA
jgi:threonine dehydratase